MRISTDARLPQNDDPKALKQRLYEIHRDMATQLNATSEGALAGASNAATAAPTTGIYAVGDIVRNSAPSELGAASSKFVLFGWLCVTSSPLAFVPLRFLTGN